MNKKLSKILLLIILFSIFYFLFSIFSASAAEVKFTPQITIPGFAEKGVPITVTGETFGQFMAALYKWATGAIAIICIVMIVYAGFRWMMAAGSASQIGKAKETMTNALIGLTLVIGAYWLLNLLNPSLVEFKSLKLETFKPKAGTSLKRIGESCKWHQDCLTKDPTDKPYLICNITDCKAQPVAENFRQCISKKWFYDYCKWPACVEYDETCQIKNADDKSGNCCDDRLICNIGSGWGFTGTCKRLVQIGSPCRRNLECLSNQCVAPIKDVAGKCK